MFVKRLHSTKADLRAEIQQLKEANDHRSALFNTLSTLNETEAYHIVSRWVMDEKKARRVGSEELFQRAKIEGERCVASRRTTPSLSSVHCLSKSDSSSLAANYQSGMASCSPVLRGLPAVSPQPSPSGDCVDGLNTDLSILPRSASAYLTPKNSIQSTECMHQESDIWTTQIDPWSWTGWTT